MVAPYLRQLHSEDAFRRKIVRIYEEVNEQVLDDEYEFLTEENMRLQDPPFSESLEATHGDRGTTAPHRHRMGIEKAFFLYKVSILQICKYRDLEWPYGEITMYSIRILVLLKTYSCISK